MTTWTNSKPVPAQEWEVDALCRKVGHPEDWTQDEPEATASAAARKRYAERKASAVAVCSRCPVRDACLEWALQTDQNYGVLGGLSARERRAATKGERVPA